MKLPDENDRFLAGQLGGLFDGLAEVSPALLDAASAAVELRSALDAAVSRPGISLFRATPGLGKSRAIREILAQSGRRAWVIVPRHDLAAQTRDELLAAGVSATAPAGPLSVRKLPMFAAEPRAVCARETELEPLTRAGVDIRRDVCPTCPWHGAHPAGGGPCVAAVEGRLEKQATAWVLQSAGMERTLAEVRESLAHQPGEAPPLVIIDEPPGHFARVPLAPALEAWRRAERHLCPEAREALGPAVEALRACPPTTPGERLSLAGLLRQRPDAAHIVAELAGYAGPLLLRDSLAWLAGGCGGAGKEAVKGWAEHFATLREFAAVLCSAARSPDAPTLDPEPDTGPALVAVGSWIATLRELAATGATVILLDATANEGAWRACCPEAAIVTIEAADGARVERRWIKRGKGSGAAKNLTGERLTRNGPGHLRSIALAAKECGAQHVAIFTFKATRERLAAALETHDETLLPAEFLALLRAGVKVSLGHFYANRGLDTWAGADLLVTMGDARPNIGAAHAEAAFLGLEADRYTEALAQAELHQTWGRLRAVHRQAAGVILHLGELAPGGPQWAAAGVASVSRGRPRKLARGGSRAAPGGTVRQRAQALGVSKRTLQRDAREVRGGVNIPWKRESEPWPEPDPQKPAVRNIDTPPEPLPPAREESTSTPTVTVSPSLPVPLAAGASEAGQGAAPAVAPMTSLPASPVAASVGRLLPPLGDDVGGWPLVPAFGPALAKVTLPSQGRGPAPRQLVGGGQVA